jgi:two-component system nitrogen regulation response regulator GlnG
MPSILVVDDEQSICWGLTRLGESLGHEVVSASSAEQAIAQAKRRTPDVIILDVRLPGMNGLAAIEHLQGACGNVPIIVITAYGDLKTAVDAVRCGAFDYIAKPFDVAKVKSSLVRALSSRTSPVTESAPQTVGHVEGMVGRTPAMQEVYKQIALAAATDAAILLLGENGTGKELAARAIHRYSRQAGGPFVAANLTADDPLIAEMELFGHVPGPLFGSDGPRSGLLAQAAGGTLFVDEVADIPPAIQVKLLRALEYGEFTPIGSVETVRSSFRVISASRHDLSQLIAKGHFRQDLYLRLSALKISLPPLRDRVPDIPELVEHFIGILAGPANAPRPAITPSAMAELQRRAWRGNVRELRGAIDHALVLARQRAIEPEHLPPEVSVANFGGASTSAEVDIAVAVRTWAEQKVDDRALAGRLYDRLLEVIEPPLLEAAMRRHKRQCATAARALGIHRTTLRKKLTEHGIEGDSE